MEKAATTPCLCCSYTVLRQRARYRESMIIVKWCSFFMNISLSLYKGGVLACNKPNPRDASHQNLNPMPPVSTMV